MRVLSSLYRYFDSINSESYIGKFVVTKECEMSTGYRGRGKPIVSETVKPGTVGKYVLRRNGSNTRCWLEVSIERPSDSRGRVELKKTIYFDLPLEEAAKKLKIIH